MTDEEIIREIKNGNNSAYRELVLRYQSMIASTVFGMLGNSPEAEDIGQEVFIRFYNAINNFRGDSAVGTYLTRIAINLSLNEIKRRKRKKAIFINDEFFDIAEQVDDGNLGLIEDKEVINRAIESLTPKFRSVLVLRMIDGYSTKEVAQILRTSQLKYVKSKGSMQFFSFYF